MTKTQPEIPYYVRALAMGIPAYLIGVQMWSWVFMAPFYLGGHSDFRQIYAAAHMFRSGDAYRLYDPAAQAQAQTALVGAGEMMPFVRPAYELLIFLPLTFLRYRLAYLVLLGVNISLLALVYWLIRPRMRNLAKIFPWLPAALFLGFLPIAGALIQGQDSVLLLAIFTAAFWLMETGRDSLAGFVIGAGVFKLQLTIPLGLLFVLWRRWDFFKGVLLAAVPAASVSVWMVGLSQTKSYIRLLLFIGQPSSGLFLGMANLHGLTFGLLGSRLPSVGIAATTAALSLAVLFYLSRHRQCGPDALLCGLIGSTLLSYYLFFHDLSSLFLPIVITLDRFLLMEWNPRIKKILLLSSSLFVFPLLLSYAPAYLYLMTLPLIGLLIMLNRIPVPTESKRAEGLSLG